MMNNYSYVTKEDDLYSYIQSFRDSKRSIMALDMEGESNQ